MSTFLIIYLIGMLAVLTTFFFIFKSDWEKGDDIEVDLKSIFIVIFCVLFSWIGAIVIWVIVIDHIQQDNGGNLFVIKNPKNKQ